MLTAATAEMDRRVDGLDAHPDLMNLANGVLNLTTFELGPHDSRLMLTRDSLVRYDARARCPEFLRFINTILPSKAVRDYVQRLCGYYLMSGNPERIFTNWYGAGRNGKSQLKELTLYVGGGYARATTPDTFLSGRRTGTVRDDLHALRGARLVAAVEPNKSAAMDEATVKEVTGGDAISTRALYGEHANWVPDFKPLLVSNHKLVIRGTDDGIWDRLKIVPFSVRIADEDVVVDYFKNVLKPEASGYLNWALDGLRQYREIGLAEPEEVRALVIEHREESDVVANFLAARCEIDEKFMAKDCVSPTDLKAAFVEYCRTQSIPYRDIDLRDRLVAMKHSPPRQSDKKYWPGIKLIKRKFEA
jgi:putative DNA primase/helicase